MQQLDDLSRNLQILLERYQALQDECAKLRDANGRQREELIRTYTELHELQNQNKRLATANALTIGESNAEATKRINALIGQIDRAIQALKV